MGQSHRSVAMGAVGRVVAILLCLFVTTACGAPRTRRVCGILDRGPFWPGEAGYLRLIELDSGAQHTLVRSEEAFFDGGLSPDGTKVLYTRRDATGPADTWIMPLDGSEPRRLLADDAPAIAGVATWSYDGRKVAISGAVEGDMRLCQPVYYVVDVASGSATRLPVCGWAGAWAAAWSPRDARIAILGGDGEDWGLWVIDTDTGATKRLLQGTVVTRFGLAWSPDAKEIAVVAGRYVDYVCVVDVESGAGRALTRTDGYDERMLPLLRWSPAGDKIAFMEEAHIRPMSEQGTGPVFVVDVETGEETRVVDYAIRGDITWSPDGREIAFDGWVEGIDHGCSAKVDVATGEVTSLTPDGDIYDILAWGCVTFVPEQGQ